jgi:hypothetical protein
LLKKKKKTSKNHGGLISSRVSLPLSSSRPLSRPPSATSPSRPTSEADDKETSPMLGYEPWRMANPGTQIWKNSSLHLPWENWAQVVFSVRTWNSSIITCISIMYDDIAHLVPLFRPFLLNFYLNIVKEATYRIRINSEAVCSSKSFITSFFTSPRYIIFCSDALSELTAS